MKTFYLSAGIFLVAFITNAQKPFVPHVVFDENNKTYAVKATANLFLKFIDSTGEFLTKHVTDGKEYIGKGHTVRVVPFGQESTFETKAEANALLDYWNELKLLREQKKKKSPQYTE
jgi:hypothetical protein